MVIVIGALGLASTVFNTSGSNSVSPFRIRKSLFISWRANQQLARLSATLKKGLNTVLMARPGCRQRSNAASTCSLP